MAQSQPQTALYNAAFFQALSEGTRRSAGTAVPFLIEQFQPRSVVDVGCGTGIWLSIFREQGITDVLGVDGAWVPESERAIPKMLFWEHDLTQTLKLDRTFDLALCLEVAEHLPASAAPLLVESLTRLAAVVVFSAAIPSQGGNGHVNEQWPSYWVTLFAAHGYDCLTDLRDRLWTNDALEVWYRQNILCFAARGHHDHLAMTNKEPIDIVHPVLYTRVTHDAEKLTYHAERLEQELRSCRNELGSCSDELGSCRDELGSCRAELAAIKSSRAWRLYRALKRIKARILD
jgi:SAM-dependent methyltransferase